MAKDKSTVLTGLGLMGSWRIFLKSLPPIQGVVESAFDNAIIVVTPDKETVVIFLSEIVMMVEGLTPEEPEKEEVTQ